MALHQTRILDTVVGGVDSNTALAFLNDNGKDESSINACLGGDCVDSRFDICGLLLRVVARSLDQDFVETPAG